MGRAPLHLRCLDLQPSQASLTGSAVSKVIGPEDFEDSFADPIVFATVIQ
jgi:hypothetical protein